jgi:putative hemolysin
MPDSPGIRIRLIFFSPEQIDTRGVIPQIRPEASLPQWVACTSAFAPADSSQLTATDLITPKIYAEAGAYRLRLAETPEDRRAACRLRFLVFNLELGKGLESSYETGLDQDRFDLCCEHLLVDESATGRVVGTYRMQSGSTAAQNAGYYSGQEFVLAPYEPLRPSILELGRAAVDREHRTPEVLTLLWRGIAQYASGLGLRYLLGCSSMNSNNPAEGRQMYHQLQRFRVAPEFETVPTDAFICPAGQYGSGEPQSRPRNDLPAEEIKIPKLLKTYLALGARIAAPPAWDREFRTIDFLTLLDLDTLSPAVRARFFAPVQP